MTFHSPLQKKLSKDLSSLTSLGLTRRVTPSVRVGQGKSLIGETEYFDLSTNDYLGIWDQTLQVALSGGLGASGSRLLSGTTPEVVAFESRFAAWVGYPSGVMFNSGYHANIGVISAIVGSSDCVIMDRLIHASIWDGVRLSGAKWKRFRHNDMAHLETLLRESHDRYRQVLVVTESIFSMDGDRAPLKEIVRLCQEFGAAVMVDEAHALGVVGPEGRGVVAELGLVSDIDIWTAGLGKAWMGVGAMVLGSETLVQWLINSARSLIYSTALPPLAVRWAADVLALMPALEPNRIQLRRLAGMLGAESHIVPIVVGDVSAAVALSDQLKEKGFWAPAIRPPTVAPRQARIRLSLSAAIPEPAMMALKGILGR